MPASSPSSDEALWRDFNALCDCGGRRAGTPSERKALALLKDRLSSTSGAFHAQTVRYPGWRCTEARLIAAEGTPLVCNPLLGSASTPPAGLSAEVVDLGRGAEEDFKRNAPKLRGRIALVRHEYMFGPLTLHRRRKLGWAMEAGAAAFIIANPEPGSGPVGGSSGRGGGAGVPAIATDLESAAGLGGQRVTLIVRGEDYDADTEVLMLEWPGGKDEWVVVSAHLDGHDLAESAMDNASGVAVALSVAGTLAPDVGDATRGLRLCLFSAEEWALAGSKHYLDRMSPAERSKLKLNINLDTVGGDARLTALTSDFARLDSFVREAAREIGFPLATYLPTMPNSDHFNFARHGIPALRLVAGFDQPASNVRHVLTRGDTRDKVKAEELRSAARIAAQLALRALTTSF
jgi:aminopeptidase YwaD